MTDYSRSGADFRAKLLWRINDQYGEHELAEDPYVLTLKRYKMLWGGEINGQGGIYSQLVNAVMIDDIYKIWEGKKPLVFQKSSKAKQFRDLDKYKNADEYFWRQQRDLGTFLKLHPDYQKD